jgi:hypothetical protein
LHILAAILLNLLNPKKFLPITSHLILLQFVYLYFYCIHLCLLFSYVTRFYAFSIFSSYWSFICSLSFNLRLKFTLILLSFPWRNRIVIIVWPFNRLEWSRWKRTNFISRIFISLQITIPLFKFTHNKFIFIIIE